MKTQLPSSSYKLTMDQGSIRSVKKNNRRSDSMAWLPVEDIHIKQGFNVRANTDKHQAHVEHIKSSMLEVGYRIDKPISVFVGIEDGEDKVFAMDGHTRLEAVHQANKEGAGINEVPVVFLPKSTSMVDLTVGLVEANMGQPLTPYEMAMVCKRLNMMELSDAEIARRLGYSGAHIGNLLLLATASPTVARMVVDGDVSATEAVAVIRKHGATKAEEVLTKAHKEANGKVTNKSLPGSGFKKAVRKLAPDLLTAAKKVTGDPNYKKLTDETRSILEEILAEVPENEG